MNLTKPNTGHYSFHSRWPAKRDAREVTRKLNGSKHAYYTRVQKGGKEFWDVRVEN